MVGRQAKGRQGMGVGTGVGVSGHGVTTTGVFSEYLSALVSAELSLSQGKGTEQRSSQAPSRPVFNTCFWKRHKLESLWKDPI